MKFRLIAPSFVVALILSSCAMAQQATPTPLASIVTSLNNMVGQVSIQDVTLNGSADVIAGSSDQTVPVELRSLLGGSSREDLTMASGVSSNISLLAVSGSAPSGTWTSGNGVQHTIAQQNLMTDSGWFFPALVIQRMISNPAVTVVYIGQEGNLLHFQSYQAIPAPAANVPPLLQHLTQMDLYLNSTTLLPAQLSFNIHPDNNASMDIPVTIQYQNYQTIGGVTLPLQVQEFVNNSLVMDLQIQTATFNSGLTASTLSAQ